MDITFNQDQDIRRALRAEAIRIIMAKGMATAPNMYDILTRLMALLAKIDPRLSRQLIPKYLAHLVDLIEDEKEKPEVEKTAMAAIWNIHGKTQLTRFASFYDYKAPQVAVCTELAKLATRLTVSWAKTVSAVDASEISKVFRQLHESLVRACVPAYK